MRNFLKPVLSVAVLGLLTVPAVANTNTADQFTGRTMAQSGYMAASHAVIGSGHTLYRMADATKGKKKFPDSAFGHRKNFPDSAFDRSNKKKKFPDSAFDHRKNFPDSAFDRRNKKKKFPDSAFDHGKKIPKTEPNRGKEFPDDYFDRGRDTPN